jgi:hypothetical protein
VFEVDVFAAGVFETAEVGQVSGIDADEVGLGFGLDDLALLCEREEIGAGFGGAALDKGITPSTRSLPWNAVSICWTTSCGMTLLIAVLMLPSPFSWRL